MSNILEIYISSIIKQSINEGELSSSGFKPRFFNGSTLMNIDIPDKTPIQMKIEGEVFPHDIEIEYDYFRYHYKRKPSDPVIFSIKERGILVIDYSKYPDAPEGMEPHKEEKLVSIFKVVVEHETGRIKIENYKSIRGSDTKPSMVIMMLVQQGINLFINALKKDDPTKFDVSGEPSLEEAILAESEISLNDVERGVNGDYIIDHPSKGQKIKPVRIDYVLSSIIINFSQHSIQEWKDGERNNVVVSIKEMGIDENAPDIGGTREWFRSGTGVILPIPEERVIFGSLAFYPETRKIQIQDYSPTEKPDMIVLLTLQKLIPEIFFKFEDDNKGSLTEEEGNSISPLEVNSPIFLDNPNKETVKTNHSSIRPDKIELVLSRNKYNTRDPYDSVIFAVWEHGQENWKHRLEDANKEIVISSFFISVDPETKKIKISQFNSIRNEARPSLEMFALLYEKVKSMVDYLEKINPEKFPRDEEEEPLEEFNSIGAGGISGGPQLPLGASTTALHKAFWARDRNKKLKTASPALHKKK